MDLKEFDDLVNLGRITRTIKLLNRELVIGTLNSREYAFAMARLPAGEAASAGDRMEAIQREIVAAALRTIDGKELSHQDKVSLVTAGQLGLSNMLYNEYLSLVDEQNQTLDSAKKNSSQGQTQSTSSLTTTVSS